MSSAPLTKISSRLGTYVDQAKTDGPVVITRNGKAVAVIVAPVDDEDLENILLTRSPRFLALLERSRESVRSGKGLTEEEFWARA